MELTNRDAAAIRVNNARLESAARMRERLDAGEISDDEFRKNMDAISGKRSNPRTAKAKVKESKPELTYSEKRAKKLSRKLNSGRMAETRGMVGRAVSRPREIQGEPGEILRADQSLTEWLRRASQNKAYETRSDGTRAYVQYADEQQMFEWVDRAIGQRAGMQTRALGETVTGAGIEATPITWQASIIDYLLPNDPARPRGHE